MTNNQKKNEKTLLEEINSKQEQLTDKKVIFIGIDGIGRFYKNAKTPTLDGIFASGVYFPHAIAVIPTDSAENWGSMITGVIPEKHSLNLQDLEAGKPYPENSFYPTIFKILIQKYPNIKMASCVGWWPINTGMIEKSVKMYRYSPLLNESKEVKKELIEKEKQGKSNYDELVTSKVVDYIKDSMNRETRFLFIHLTDTDEHGHYYGFGSLEHLKQIEKADSQIGQVLQAVKENWGENVLTIITTDHGGINVPDSQGRMKGIHGGDDPQEIEVFLAASGKEIRQLKTDDKVTNMDSAAITLEMLEVRTPKWFDSKLPEALG